MKSLEALTTICCICTSLWFVGKVKGIKQSTYSERSMYSKCVLYFEKKITDPKFEMLYICYMCDSYLLKGKTQPQATVNNMKICDSDPVCSSVNNLEQQLISNV